MIIQRHIFSLLIIASSITCIAQGTAKPPNNNPATQSHGPTTISRTIKQDRKGNIWIASWDGMFSYDGKSMTNVTSKITSQRFFSVLEDSKGNMWFGSVGSGVFRYDGKSFKNYTTDDGLVNNEVTTIYEDKAGTIWFGMNGGISRFDGKSFRNYLLTPSAIVEDKTRKIVPNQQRPPHEVNAIVDDRTGNLWFATRDYAFKYDGKTFTTLLHDSKPFSNVRCLIEDSKGNIWLGGKDGLWRSDGEMFKLITTEFIGYIYEDSKRNIWTSGEGRKNFFNGLRKNNGKTWELSRYNEKSLSSDTPVPEIIKSDEGMIFGILEAVDGSIWFGTLDGVHRYDGKLFYDWSENYGR